MSGSDSDLERASSLHSSKKSFESVPEDTDFKIKLFDIAGNLYDKFLYTLKKGKELPCSQPVQSKKKSKLYRPITGLLS